MKTAASYLAKYMEKGAPADWLLALCLAAVILAPTAARAEASLIVHGVSYHLDERQHISGRDWNERNAGAGLRWEFSPVRAVQVGAYKNSIEKNSLYALGDYTPWAFGPVRVGGFAGLRTGYTAPVLPMGGAVLRWDVTGRNAVTVRAWPKAAPKSSAGVSIEFGVKL